jgi:carbonic anhydrase
MRSDCDGGCDRRRVLQLAGMAMAGLAVAPRAHAQSGGYDAMLLSCIDPRLVTPVYDHMRQAGLSGKYSQFCIAGAAVAVVAPKFETWRPAFWDNLAATIQLHRIRRLVAIDHRDCGAARIAYGEAALATPEAETETHRRVFAEFRREMAQRHPELAVETGLMALDGSLMPLG